MSTHTATQKATLKIFFPVNKTLFREEISMNTNEAPPRKHVQKHLSVTVRIFNKKQLKYRIGGIKTRQTPGCPTLPLWTDTGVKASCATLRGQSARGTGLMLPSCAPSPLAGTVLGFLVPTTLRK